MDGLNLPSVAEEKASIAGNLEAFGGFNITQARRDIQLLLDGIRNNGLFEEYTRHDISHIDAMLAQLDWIIPPRTREKMTPADWLLIVLSVYFHDLGMLVTKAEFKGRNTTAFSSFRESVFQSEDDQSKDYALRIKALSMEDADRFLYQEFVRANHASRIREWIAGNDASDSGFPVALVAEIRRILAPLDEVFLDDLASVCESHHLDDLYDISKYPVSRPYGPSPSETANVQYSAVLLRTVDLLHITRDRAPSISFRLIDPQDPTSQIEWAKQNAVRTVRPKLGMDNDGNYAETAPKDTIEVHARFTNGDGFFGLTAYLTYAESQLKKSHSWIGQSNRQYGTVHQFPWIRIDTSNIETKGFLSHPFEFTFDQAKVLDLLTGHTLYNDSNVVLRELVQNSIDAVRLAHPGRVAADGKVRIVWEEKSRTLEVWDNGTGMTQEIIEQNLLKVGSSRYQDPRFKRENPGFNPISRFGIGVLSAFMIADRVEVVTCHKDEQDGRRLSLRSVHGKYLVKLVGKTQDPDAQVIGVHGTLFRLVLRPSAKLADVLSLLRKWIIIPGCRVSLVRNGGEPIKIGHSSTKEALTDYLESNNFEVSDGSNESKGDVRVIERSAEGISLSYAVRWNSYFKQWDFLSSPSRDRIRGESPPPVVGISVEGVRVEDQSPGFYISGPWAFANVFGEGAPKTNVARSAIERNEGYSKILKEIYSIYCDHISSEMQAIHEERGQSLTWATSEGGYLLNALMAGRPTSEVDFDEAVRSIRLFLVESEGKRESRSAQELLNYDHFWTLESSLALHVEYLLREMPGEASLSQLIEIASGVSSPVRQKILLCSRISSHGALSEIICRDWEVTQILVNEENRQCEAEWSRIRSDSSWVAGQSPMVSGHINSVIDDFLQRVSESRRLRFPAVPISRNVKVSGLTGRESAVRIGGTTYLVPGHPWEEFIEDSKGIVNPEKAAILSAMLAHVASSNQYGRGRYGRPTAFAIDPDEELSISKFYERSAISSLIDCGGVVRTLARFGLREFDVSRWRRKEGE